MGYTEYKWQTKNMLELFAREWTPSSQLLGAVCLVHGLGEHSGRYEEVADFLTGNGYAVLAFDLRGYGKSQGKRGHTPSYDTLMDDIDILKTEAEKHFPGVPHFLYGHSLGGNLVLNYILRRHPKFDGVIVTGPWLKLVSELPPGKISLIRVMDKIWPGFTQKNGLSSEDLSHNSQISSSYTHDPLVHSYISVRLFTGVYDSGIWALEHAGEFGPPLLLMHGTADRITSADASRQFAESLADRCTLKLWDGLYHELHNETQKQDVMEYILHWLEGIVNT